MGEIRTEDIVGYNHDSKVWCPDCWDKMDTTGIELTEEEYIVRSDLEKDDSRILFCDECHHEL